MKPRQEVGHFHDDDSLARIFRGALIGLMLDGGPRQGPGSDGQLLAKIESIEAELKRRGVDGTVERIMDEQQDIVDAGAGEFVCCLYPGCSDRMKRDGLCVEHVLALVKGDEQAQEAVRQFHTENITGVCQKPHEEKTMPKDANEKCRACGRNTKTQRGICGTCYQYARHHPPEDCNDRADSIREVMLPSKTTGKNAEPAASSQEPAKTPVAPAVQSAIGNRKSEIVMHNTAAAICMVRSVLVKLGMAEHIANFQHENGEAFLVKSTGKAVVIDAAGEVLTAGLVTGL